MSKATAQKNTEHLFLTPLSFKVHHFYWRYFPAALDDIFQVHSEVEQKQKTLDRKHVLVQTKTLSFCDYESSFVHKPRDQESTT